MRPDEKPPQPSALPLLGMVLVALVMSCGGSSELPAGPKVEVVIEPGMSLPQVARVLADAGVIDNELLFRFRCWYEECESDIRPGRYRLPRHSSPRAVMRILTGRAAAYRMVTIPEGLTVPQTAAILAAHGICDSAGFVTACSDTAVLRAARVPLSSAEGFLFPETYEFLTGTKPAAVVVRLVGQFWRIWNAIAPGDSRPAETVILASIVEREAQVASERPVVAGVFANRLRRHIPLMSCATVEFALPEHRARLRYTDLRYPSPYNTYLHPGLPPGPICSPGRASLEAAFRPAPHDYVFFVSRGDGTHVFSRTSAEHDAAIEITRHRR